METRRGVHSVRPDTTSDPAPHADTSANPNPAPDSHARSYAHPSPHADPNPDTNTDSNPDPRTHANSPSNPDSSANSDPTPNSNSGPDTYSSPNPHSRADSHTTTHSNAHPNSSPDSDPNPHPNTRSNTHSSSYPHANPNPYSGPDPNTAPHAYAHSNPNAPSNPSHDPHSNTHTTTNHSVTEIEKYQGIYSNPDRFPRYGHSNHGRGAVPIIQKWEFKSLVDVGCGHNELAKKVRELFPERRIVGVDFACPSADVKADADALPFADQSFDVLTAFDVLEHLIPEQIAATLSGFARVSKAFVFSISYVPSVYKWEGETLHPTVKDESWWMEQITLAGGIEIQKIGRYLIGRWSGSEKIAISKPPVARGSSCVLVGNGPSVLSARRGFDIDCHDEVVRFNDYKISGFEEHTGTRTTIWSTFGRGVVPQEPKIPNRVIVVHGNAKPSGEPDEVWRIPMSYFNTLRERVRERSEHTPENRERIIPSSGLLVSLWLLDQIDKIILIGFDHFRKDKSKLHHYWIPKTFGRPKEHDGDAEALLLAPLVADGRISYMNHNQ